MSTDDQQGEARTATDTKNLTVRGEIKDSVLVASVAGRVDSNNAQEFQEALEALLAGTVRALVLDLEQLVYISSAGLRVMLLISRQMQGRSGKFGVCSLSGSINEVFSISSFDKIIPVHAALGDALSSISK